MTQQEAIEQNVRLALGDLTLQLIIARARIAELESGIEPKEDAPVKANGVDRAEEHVNE